MTPAGDAKLRNGRNRPGRSTVVPVMTARRSLLCAATAALTLLSATLLSACARPGGDPGATPEASSPAAPAAGLVLRMTQEGGLVAPERIPGRSPQVSVYADGRVLTEGPQIMIYPGPALADLQVLDIGASRAAGLVTEAVAAGVRTGTDVGQPAVADAPATRFFVVSGGQEQSVSVPALGEAAPDDPRLTPAQRDARARLNAFAGKLRDLAAAPGAKPYRAERVAALAEPWSAPDDGLPGTPSPVAWPGPPLPGAPLAPGVKRGCVTATGEQAAAVLAAAATAKQNTPWTSGAEKYRVTFRPLLPDETGCADLKKVR